MLTLKLILNLKKFSLSRAIESISWACFVSAFFRITDSVVEGNRYAGFHVVVDHSCNHHLHYHCHDSPLWAIAFLITFFLLWISWQQIFYEVGLSTPRPSPNLEDQTSVFVTPGDGMTQLYPQALSTHFNRLLRHAWATLGILLFSAHHTKFVVIIATFN
jgi:hypothetical protein